jgi:hypothetical protein
MRRTLRLLPWALLTACLLLLAAAAVAAWLAMARQPLVVSTATVSHDDIARARALLQQHNPGNTRPGIERGVTLGERDLELLVNHGGQRLGEVRSRVRLQPGVAVVQISLGLADTPWGRWLNLQAVLRQTDGLPDIERLRIGHLPVPAWLAEWAWPHLLAAGDLSAQGALAQKVVRRATFLPRQLALTYTWPGSLRQAFGQSLLPADEQARLQAYANQLAAVAQALPAGYKSVSVAQVLPPLFALARQRSTDAASAARENRSALVALALVAYGPGLSAMVPASVPVARGRPLVFSLAGRKDTPQHYLISAALAAEGGGPLSDAIGLYKEVADSRGGSGFSFHDLAADRAGTRLGGLALRQPQLLQSRLAAGLNEAQLLPPMDDLPESMAEAEFQRRFGGVGAPAYQAKLADIEARLDRLPLLSAR